MKNCDSDVEFIEIVNKYRRTRNKQKNRLSIIELIINIFHK